MANIKTIVLSGAEQAVVLNGANCDIRNDGTDIVYASADAGIAAGADGVLSIPAGGAVKLLDCEGIVYLLGTGSVMLCGNDLDESVFKSAATSSGGGGGEDTVARQAITTHSNNSEIHVTADERSAWNNKAEPSDIPTSLPADGGNAATVNGHTVYSDVPANAKFTDTIVTVDTALSTTSTNPVQNKAVTAQLNAYLSASKTYADGKLIVGTEPASLDNCPVGCWYGQYST